MGKGVLPLQSRNAGELLGEYLGAICLPSAMSGADDFRVRVDTGRLGAGAQTIVDATGESGWTRFMNYSCLRAICRILMGRVVEPRMVCGQALRDIVAKEELLVD